MSTGNIVHGLWISGELSPIEMLTVHSYTSLGYEFVLWTYGSTDAYKLPQNASVRDAAEIIPRDKVFSYKHKNQFGHGKGSYAGFSDIFRYKLLYEFGGWWTDMDITCLQRLDFQSDYVFRRSKAEQGDVVGNLMHVPPKSPLMESCFQKAFATIDAENKDWMAPIRILNEGIIEYNLMPNIYVFTNDDSWPIVSRLLIGKGPVSPDWKAIHWMNEEFRRIGLPKNKYLKDSFLGVLLAKNKLGVPFSNFSEGIKYRWKVSRFYYGLLYLREEKPLKAFGIIVFQMYCLLFRQYEKYIKPHADLGKPFRKKSNKLPNS